MPDPPRVWQSNYQESATLSMPNANHADSGTDC